MNKKIVLFTTALFLVILTSLQFAFAYDPYYSISGGKIRNVCGGIENDPNCLNTCDVSTGSCYAPSSYSIWVFTCDGVAKRSGTNDYECLENGVHYSTGSTKKISEFAQNCKTIQIDVVTSNGVATDWLVWVADQQTNCGSTTTTTSTTSTTTSTTLPATCNSITVNVNPSPVTSGNAMVFTAQSSYGYTCVSMNANGGSLVNSNTPDSISCSGGVCTWKWFGMALNPGTYTAKFTGEKGGASCLGIPSQVTCSNSITYVVNPTTPPTTLPPFFNVDLYNVNVNPSSITRGNDITVEASLKLVDAPSGYYDVTTYWFVDGVLKTTQVISMTKGQTVTMIKNFGTSDLSTGTHIVRVEAKVSNAFDSDSDFFDITSSQSNDLRLGSLSVSPSTICQSESEVIDFSVPVTLNRGRDNTEILTQFFIESNDGGLMQVDSQRMNLDVGETRTFRGSFSYSRNEFSLGTHDVKVVAENGDREEDFATLNVVSCPIIFPQSVDVGFISLTPEFSNQGEIVLGSVPISLRSTTSLPRDVFVTVKLDGNVLTTSSLRFGRISTQTFQFTVNTAFLSTGIHNVQVIAEVDGVSDSSFRSFTVGPIPPTLPGAPQHCIVVEDIWSDRELRDGENFQISSRVRNCGLQGETITQTTFEGLSKTLFSGPFFLPAGKTKDVTFTVFVPDEFFGETAFKVKTFSQFATDEFSKNFIVQSGFPTLNLDNQYNVKTCDVNPIQFKLSNAGAVKDTFTVFVSGGNVDWFTNLPQQVTLNSKESRTVEGLVNVPCNTEPGLYQFTLTAKGSPDVSVTSTLKVSKPFTFPKIGFPTGFAVAVKELVPWILLTLLIFLILVLLLLALSNVRFQMPASGRRTPERCLDGHGC